VVTQSAGEGVFSPFHPFPATFFKGNKMAKLKVNVPIDIESVDGGAAMAAEIGQLRSKVGRLEKSVAGYKSRLTKEKSQRDR
jgi:hypothetical protein